MVRRVIRVLELPVSLSVGVLRQSASLAGRVVSRLLVGGGPDDEPVPPRAPEPARTSTSRRPTASTDELAPARARSRRPARPKRERPPRAKGERSARTRGERPVRAPARKRAERDDAASERAEPSPPVQDHPPTPSQSEELPSPAASESAREAEP